LKSVSELLALKRLLRIFTPVRERSSLIGGAVGYLFESAVNMSAVLMTLLSSDRLMRRRFAVQSGLWATSLGESL